MPLHFVLESARRVSPRTTDVLDLDSAFDRKIFR